MIVVILPVAKTPTSGYEYLTILWL